MDPSRHVLCDNPPVFIFTFALLSATASPPPGDPSTLGPAVGQPLPAFEAKDQHGQPRDFTSLKGPNGLVLVFFRSADW